MVKKKTSLSRSLAILLTLVMVIGMLPIQALANADEFPEGLSEETITYGDGSNVIQDSGETANQPDSDGGTTDLSGEINSTEDSTGSGESTGSTEAEYTYDSQPQSEDDVLAAVYAWADTDFAPESAPHWQFTVGDDVMPTGFYCKFVNGDEFFDTPYYTVAVSVRTLEAPLWDNSEIDDDMTITIEANGTFTYGGDTYCFDETSEIVVYGNLTIVLNGALVTVNSIEVNGDFDVSGTGAILSAAPDDYGISVAGDLTVTGCSLTGTSEEYGVHVAGNILVDGGSLTGEATSNPESDMTDVYGVLAEGTITVKNGGTLDGTANGICGAFGVQSNCSGYWEEDGIPGTPGITVESGGSLTGTAEGSDETCGVKTWGSILVNGGTLDGTATSGSSATGVQAYSSGYDYYDDEEEVYTWIETPAITVENGGSITGIAEGLANAHGVVANGSILVNDGTLDGTATSGSYATGVQAYKQGYGYYDDVVEGYIWIECPAIIVENGGSLTGTVINSESAYGVLADGRIIVDGGTLDGTATGSSYVIGVQASSMSDVSAPAITLESGSLTGAANGAEQAYGVRTYGGILQNGGNLKGEGYASEPDGWSTAYGVYAGGGIDITDGELEGAASGGMHTIGVWANSNWNNPEGPSITVTGGKLTGLAEGNGAYELYGVYTYGAIIAQSGGIIEGTANGENLIGYEAAGVKAGCGCGYDIPAITATGTGSRITGNVYGILNNEEECYCNLHLYGVLAESLGNILSEDGGTIEGNAEGVAGSGNILFVYGVAAPGGTITADGGSITGDAKGGNTQTVGVYAQSECGCGEEEDDGVSIRAINSGSIIGTADGSLPVSDEEICSCEYPMVSGVTAFYSSALAGSNGVIEGTATTLSNTDEPGTPVYGVYACQNITSTGGGQITGTAPYYGINVMHGNISATGDISLVKGIAMVGRYENQAAVICRNVEEDGGLISASDSGTIWEHYEYLTIGFSKTDPKDPYANGGNTTATGKYDYYIWSNDLTVSEDTTGLVATKGYAGTQTVTGTREGDASGEPVILSDGSSHIISFYGTFNGYTVVYNSNYGTAAKYSFAEFVGDEHTVCANDGTSFEKLTRNDYTFLGWSENPEATSATYTGSEKIGSGAAVGDVITLYAVWVPVYKVTYNANGGTGAVPVDSTNYTSGTTVTVLGQGDLEREGYTFSGWQYNFNFYNEGNTFTITKDVTLYAMWTKEVPITPVTTYKVTYNANGGTGAVPVDTTNYTSGTTVTVLGQGDLEREGYTFSGWQYGINFYNEGNTFTITEDVTLYAMWTKEVPVTPVTYSVAYEFVSSDGTTALPQEVLDLLPSDTATYEDGTTVTAIDPAETTVVTTDGTWTFTGWDEDSKTVDGEDVTFTGTWKFTPNTTPTTYTVTYNANGGTGSYKDTGLSSGDSYTVLTQSATGIIRSNYTFTGWNTKADGTGTAYSAGKIIIVNSDVILYAQWTPSGGGGGGENKTTYTVTYDANGGTGSHKDTGLSSGDSYTVRTLTATGISRDGYTFTGWNTKADGSGTAYDPKDIFTVTGNVTLYAQWEKSLETEGNTSQNNLDESNHFAYIIGYPDGTVKPEGNITRAEVATIFFRLLTQESRAELWSKTNSFSDVASEAWYNNAISTLANGNIIKGYPDGTFAPNAPITRAEFATIATKFAKAEDIAKASGTVAFSDIAGHWAEDNIALAGALGYVNGYGDGTFRPDEPITRAEVATLLNRVLNRHVESEDDLLTGMVTWPDNRQGAWYYFAVQEATNSHYYDRKADGTNEIWTELRSVPNWVALEKPGSVARDVSY